MKQNKITHQLAAKLKRRRNQNKRMIAFSRCCNALAGFDRDTQIIALAAVAATLDVRLATSK